MNYLISSLLAPVSSFVISYRAFLIVIAISVVLLAMIASIVILSITLARISREKREVESLSVKNTSKDEDLTQEERAMLDGFRGLDAEKKKALIQTAHIWRNSN